MATVPMSGTHDGAGSWAGVRPDPGAVDTLLAGARVAPYWLDRAERPAALPPLITEERADLVVVGGGFTGLWAALSAVERDPGRSVVLIEGDRIAEHASGRNGGFMSSSLTHGLAHGLDRFPDELPALLRLGAQTLDTIEDAITRHGIDCGFERTGELTVAVAPWQAEELTELHATATELGETTRLLDGEQMRAEVASPTYLGGLEDPGCALVDPARLAWGLTDACRRLGVRFFENTRVEALEREGTEVVVRTTASLGTGSVRAQRVLLATAAIPGLLPAMRSRVVPVWDYSVMTEPLPADVRASLGWSGRQGIGDAGNRFHYYRLTHDDRLLFGGYDAIYPFGGGQRSGPRDTRDRARHEPTTQMLGEHLLATFPQLEGVRASHTWGGAVDTCSRFNPFWGTSMRGQVGYVLGFTGLGVGASNFGARTALDLVDGIDSEATRLEMVRKRPLPFPPEPLRWVGIQITRHQLARADANGGRRSLWLKALDAAGLGFDS